MQNSIIRAFCIYAVLVVFTASAQESNSKLTRSTYDPSFFKVKNIEVWKQFNKKYKNRLRVKWNPITGTPNRISGRSITIVDRLTKKNIEAVTRRLLVKLKAVLQVNSKNLIFYRADFYAPKRPKASTGTWYVYFRQEHRGIPVYGSSVRLIIRNQTVTTLGSDYYPGINIPIKSKISLAQATETVQLDLGIKSSVNPVDGKLLIFPRPISGKVHYHLAWRLILPVTLVPKEHNTKRGQDQSEMGLRITKEPVQLRYYVDAHTGRIIAQFNALKTADMSGDVTGMIHPLYSIDTPVSAPISDMTVTLTQNGTTFTTATDASGDYDFNGLDTNAVNINAQFTGPHVIVGNDETPDPGAFHEATINSPGVHSWNWDADDPSPENVETNAFYHVNWIWNWFLQIDPTLSNSKPTPYPMNVSVRSSFFWVALNPCNAAAYDGGLAFGKGVPEVCPDFALCTDVIYHEFTHRVVSAIYGDKGIELPYVGYTGAMNEGWADYFSSSALQDPIIIEECRDSYIRNIDTPDKRLPDDWKDDVHIDSMILAGSLWDTRTALGAEYVDGLALRAMKHNTLNFHDYLGALLDEDDDSTFNTDPLANNDLTDGTPNDETICQAFHDLHGIYHYYCSGLTTLPIAWISSPSPTSSFNLIVDSSTTIPIIGSADGTLTSPLQSFGLEYAHESSPGIWLSDSVTLIGNGTAPVGDALLGQLNTTGLAGGVYAIRLTVNLADGSSATATVNMLLDLDMMAGWPQEIEELNFLKSPVIYSASPAIADLDPLSPGLEIVAATYKLYVWRNDGTLAPGWPKSFGTRIAPAVGDLDGDGDMEIVVHSSSGAVNVFHHNGDKLFGPKSTNGNNQWSTPALADLDKDGDLEIVVGSTDTQVYAWHHDGTDVVNWPKSTGGIIESSPALGDLDGDGSIEVVINSNDGYVHAWTASGDSLPDWPKFLDPKAPPKTSSPVLGDLDGDGYLEVVITAGSNIKSSVYVLHHSDSSVADWFVAIPSSYIERPGSPILADITGDAFPEILTRVRNGSIYAWTGDGTPVSGWPPNTPGLFIFEEDNSSPAVTDLDGDGNMEVVADAGKSPVFNFTRYNISAFHNSGAPFANWPKSTNNNRNSTPAIADIDLDGDVEVVVGSHGLFVWDLPGSFSSASAEWPFYRQDIRRTGTYGDTAPPIITLISDSEVEIEACSVYSDIGATVKDDIDGDLTNAIITDVSKVVSSVPGDYIVTYDASDDAGNAAVQKTRIVKVVDTIAPVISLYGYPEITIPTGSTYMDAGATATDCVDGNFAPGDITLSNPVDATTPNTYIVTYDVSDSAGNEADQITRIVHVKDKEISIPIDTSGSMLWRHDGTKGVPISERRITLAKQAIYPFLAILNDYNTGMAKFGIARFPTKTWGLSVGCKGEVVTPMTLVTTNSVATAISSTLPSLNPKGNTPLVDGMNKSLAMFNPNADKVIVLLSDDYQNCPSFVSLGSPPVTELINQLQAAQVRVFTIGFGKPTDVDHPLLEALADQTTPPGFVGSQFYDVTAPAFDPVTWNPAVALQETYKAILVDTLGLESAVDPRTIIKSGEKHSFDVRISKYDRKVSFFISWATSQAKRLGLKVRSSDGQAVQLKGKGVSVRSGNTYQIITLDKTILNQSGKVGHNPWKMVIEPIGLNREEQETYQYSVIMDSALKMQAGFNNASYGTGDIMIITARLSVAGRPLTGLSDVQVKITWPREGRGNWFAANKISAEELSRIPEKHEEEILSPLQRKALFLTEELKVAFPGRSEVSMLRLYDDGTHGDSISNDGIYSSRFSRTAKEGTYSFLFEAGGSTNDGNTFERMVNAQKWVTVNVTGESIVPAVEHLNATDSGINQFRLVIIPKDAQGNFLGPQYAEVFKIKSSKGILSDTIQDHLDGTYSQILQMPASISPENVDIQVSYKKMTQVFNLAEKIKPKFNTTLISVSLLILAGLLIFSLLFLLKRNNK